MSRNVNEAMPRFLALKTISCILKSVSLDAKTPLKIGVLGAALRPQHPRPAELLWRASPIALNCAQVVSILIKHVGHGQLMISCPFLLCVAEIGGCSNP